MGTFLGGIPCADSLKKCEAVCQVLVMLFTKQSGRQIDLSKVLPTQELFLLNLEEGYFACQLNQSEKFLKIFKISRLCDGTSDCYQGSDELYDELR